MTVKNLEIPKSVLCGKENATPVFKDDRMSFIKGKHFSHWVKKNCDCVNNLQVVASTTSQFFVPKHMAWNPQLDITAYELAKCLPHIGGHNSCAFKHLIPQELLRHFKEVE